MVPLRGGRDRGGRVSAAALAPSPRASTTTSSAGRRGDLVAAAVSVPRLSRASASVLRPGAAVPSGRSPRAGRGLARPRASILRPRTRAPVGRAQAATTPRRTPRRGPWPHQPSPLQRLNQPAAGAAAATSTPGPVPPLRVAPRPCRWRWRRAGAVAPKEPAMGAAGVAQRPCHQGWGKRTPPRRTPRTPRRSRCPRCRCAPRR